MGQRHCRSGNQRQRVKCAMNSAGDLTGLQQALRQLRAAGKMSLEQTAIAASRLLKAEHDEWMAVERATRRAGAAIPIERPLLEVTRTTINGWVNEGKLPKWPQLWAVVRVWAKHANDARPLDELRNAWQHLHLSASQIPRTRHTTEPASDTLAVGRIPSQPTDFVDRRALQQLRDSLGQHALVQVVTGMRGVGKTQLAAAIAREHLATRECGLVGWIDSETDGTLLEGLAAIAERVGVPDHEGDSEKSARRLRDYLTGRSEAGLLVFDNASDADRVSQFIPPLSGTKVLITSTARDFAILDSASTLDLGVFDRPESVRYLCSATNLTDETKADAVATALGDLPLALTQAAATIAVRRLDFSRYLQLLIEPLPHAFTRLRGHAHPQRVDKAILLSIESTDTPTDDSALDSAVSDLLGLVAMLSPAGVERWVLPDYDGRVDEAIARCVQGSLLSWSEDGSAVTMHRLVARVLRERADSDHTRLLGNAINAISQRAFTETYAWNRRADGAHLADQIEAIASTDIAGDGSAASACVLDLRRWAGRQLVRAADITRAISHTEQTFTDSVRILGFDHLSTLAARNNLALAFQEAGRLAEAIANFEQNLADYERTLGPDHLDILAPRQNLADAYLAAGQLGSAIGIYERNLADRERILGPEHPGTLIGRNNLASAFEAAGRLTDAIRLFELNLAEHEHALGAEHPDTLKFRDNLAGAYLRAGRFSDALPLAERSVVEYERGLGPDHPDTLIACNNLAHVYQATKQFTKAITALEENLARTERVLGPDSPHTHAGRHNVANAYRAAGRLTEAVPLLVQNLDNHERIFGPSHPQTLTSRDHLALAYQEAGQVSTAIELLETTLADRTRSLGPNHPETLASHANLASAYGDAGQTGEAIKMLEQNLSERERILGPDHPDTLAACNNLACAYKAAGKLAKATVLFKQSLEHQEQILGPDHPHTLTFRDNLAHTHMSAEDVESGIPLFEQNLRARERILGPDHTKTLETRDNLAYALRAAGQPDSALPLFEQNLAHYELVLGPDHPTTLAARDALALAYQTVLQPIDAIGLLQQNLAAREQTLGPDHPNTLVNRDDLAHAHRGARQLSDAVGLFEQNLITREQTLSANHPDILANRDVLAHAYKEAHHFPEAAQLYERILADRKRQLGPEHPATWQARTTLAFVRYQQRNQNLTAERPPAFEQ
ncbi:tetratricopeptide repeat protein [Nocardia sp. NBC_00403]|uniref:tetratricopeptide repeat protein n=1 Tax=Nocardia sp. NBC_00403 TaxID=2975990 RepID=UPI002E21AE9C